MAKVISGLGSWAVQGWPQLLHLDVILYRFTTKGFSFLPLSLLSPFSPFSSSLPPFLPSFLLSSFNRGRKTILTIYYKLGILT